MCKRARVINWTVLHRTSRVRRGILNSLPAKSKGHVAKRRWEIRTRSTRQRRGRFKWRAPSCSKEKTNVWLRNRIQFPTCPLLFLDNLLESFWWTGGKFKLPATSIWAPYVINPNGHAERKRQSALLVEGGFAHEINRPAEPLVAARLHRTASNFNFKNKTVLKTVGVTSFSHFPSCLDETINKLPVHCIVSYGQ